MAAAVDDEDSLAELLHPVSFAKTKARDRQRQKTEMEIDRQRNFGRLID